MVQCRSRQPRKVFVMSILLIVWIVFAVAVGMYARNYRDRDQAGAILHDSLLGSCGWRSCVQTLRHPSTHC